MDRLSDFHPIDVCELPDIGALETSGLIIVVGPNSSGKSQLLRDVYHRLCGEVRNLVVAKRMVLRKPDLNPLVECMEREGLVSWIEDANGARQLRPLTTFVGSGQPAAQISANQPNEWHQRFTPDDVASSRRPSEFLNYFGRLMVTGLFLDRRLTSINQVGAFDFENQPPQHDVQALYMDEDAKRKLFDEVATTFGKGLWIDASKGNTLCVRVNDEPAIPSAEDRLQPKKMVKFRQIETEGDGFKSYVSTCVALLLGRRPVCVLDEPEMCLHPPQAYNLGRFIGRYGTSSETCTFVATHSSHILRGAILTAQKIQIVRLTRRDGQFHAHRVDANNLNEALKKPTVRAETILDGIFAQGVVIVEADTDRTVYQATWETLQDELGLDVHIAPVGGTGGVADTVKLYRTLHIPVAIVTDLDLLVDLKKLRDILDLLSPPSEAEQLSQEASAISLAIKSLPPTVDPTALASELADLAKKPMNWANNDDEAIRKKLAGSANALDRMRHLKRGGVEALPEELKAKVSSLMNRMKARGLFLVPKGEVEGWLGTSVTVSKDRKWAWANEAARIIRERGPQSDDVWAFMREIGQWLRAWT